MNNIPDYIQESPRFRFIHGSVVNYELVHEIMSQSDLVVHFAAESHVTRSILNDYVFFETEVIGTRAMMQALINNKDTVKRFVHISTSEVYGTAEYQPMDEYHPLKPRSPYAASKAAADRLVFAYGCTYDTPSVIIRPFNNYGPRQHLEKLIPHLIASAIRGEDLTIHGNGSQTRDWIHTYDTFLAIDRVLHTPNFDLIKHQEINIGTGKDTSVLEIAKLILKYFNLPESKLKFVNDRPGQVEVHISSVEKARKLLDWKPTIEMSDGLEATIKWYTNNPSRWKEIEAEEVVFSEKKAA